MEPISTFRGQYEWLSNFYPCSITLDGYVWRSTECYYQAQKFHNLQTKLRFTDLSGNQAKSLARSMASDIRSDWTNVSMDVMERALAQKFTFHNELGHKLMATGDVMLIEGNYWHDLFWGQCICAKHQGKGENHLGRLLMARRAILRG